MSSFEPKCCETTQDFGPRLARAANALSVRLYVTLLHFSNHNTIQNDTITHIMLYTPLFTKLTYILCVISPVSSGNAVFFSHADPCAFLVASLCGLDPALTAPVAPCAVFRLERLEGEEKFRLTVNGSISHLRRLGKTEVSCCACCCYCMPYFSILSIFSVFLFSFTYL